VRTIKPPLTVPFLADQDALETLALLVGGDLTRHADMVHRRHEDQEAARERDVAGDARTLLGNRLLGNLHQDFLPLLQQLTDDRQVAGLGVLPASIVAAAAIVAPPSASTALIVAWPASRLPGHCGYLPFFRFRFLDSLGKGVLQLIFRLLLLNREAGSIAIDALLDMGVAHHFADLAACRNFLVERLLFQLLQVVVFALDIKRRKVVLLFVRDLFFLHQPGLGLRRRPGPPPPLVEVRLQFHLARVRRGEGGRLLAGLGRRSSAAGGKFFCFRGKLLLLLAKLEDGGGKTKFAGRGRVDTIRGGSFLRLKLDRRRGSSAGALGPPGGFFANLLVSASGSSFRRPLRRGSFFVAGAPLHAAGELHILRPATMGLRFSVETAGSSSWSLPAGRAPSLEGAGWLLALVTPIAGDGLAGKQTRRRSIGVGSRSAWKAWQVTTLARGCGARLSAGGGRLGRALAAVLGKRLSGQRERNWRAAGS
jgi:hypothetical protein